MRSSMLMGALCAAGAMGNPLDKRAYTTDWTIVTVTTTITAGGLAAAETSTYVPAPEPVSSVEPAEPQTTAPAPVESTAVFVEVPTTTTTPAPVEPTTAEQPATTSTSAGVVEGLVSAWTSAWTSSWTSSTSQPTTLASTTSSASSATATNSYQSAVLYNHNVHRSNHSASSLEWSSTLEASAQALAAKCVYQHDTTIDGGGYGQNIGYGVSSGKIGEMITNLMYNDEMGYFEALYGQASPDMSNFDAWGHFSQIVWKGTTHVGCATVTCNSLGNVDSSVALPFTVCNYSPAGNYAGEYATNVLKPLGQAMYVA
ncbi:hypothetical protein BBP40_004207 [Aspergillus hancockii]|nr:hypothetical protein BBP40_004207 [Aspergillus hancockii]